MQCRPDCPWCNGAHRAYSSSGGCCVLSHTGKAGMVHPSYFSLSGLPSDGAFVIAFSCSAYAFSDLSGSFYDCLFPPASLEKGELFHVSFTEGLRFHAPCSLLSPRTNSCLALSMFSQTAIQCLYPVSKGYTIPARSSKLYFDKGAGKNRFNGFISGSQVLTNGALPNSSSSGASLSSEPLSEAECWLNP